MRESVAFLLLGASLLVACGGASSADSSGKVADNAAGGVAGSAAGAPGEAGDAGVSGAAGTGAATAGGGTSGAGNPAGSAGSQAGGSDFGGSPGSLFISELRDNSPGLCLQAALPKNAALDQTTCVVIEALAEACDCTAAGRTPTSPALVTAIQNKLRIAGSCGAAGLPACADFCICNIAQEEGASGAACKADAVAAGMNATVSPGFCYVDDPTSPQLSSCPTNYKQKVLFVSKADHVTPSPGALSFLACPR